MSFTDYLLLSLVQPKQALPPQFNLCFWTQHAYAILLNLTSLFNPLPAKVIIYMLSFPVVEGVLPFMESHLTLCSLHKGQTSQDNFAGVAALEALTDIRESPQLVSGKTRGGK